MLSRLLSLFGGLKAGILGVAGIVAGLWALWAKRKINRQADTIDHQDRVIRGHQAKEKVHEQDRVLETEADDHIAEIRKKVDHAERPEQAAQVVGDALNEYFGSKVDNK